MSTYQKHIEITDKIGVLVIEQVRLDEQILLLTDQLNGAIGHENAMASVQPMRNDLAAKQTRLTDVKNSLSELRTSLTQVYEKELARLEKLDDMVTEHGNKLLRLDLKREIAKLKKILYDQPAVS